MHTTLTHDPVVVDRPAQPYLGTRRPVTMATIPEIADRFGDLVAAVLAAGRVPAGAPFLRYLVIDMDAILLVEAGVPLDEPLGVQAGDVYDGELPAGRFVTVTHSGHPGTLVGATGDLLRWADSRGLTFDRRPGPDGDVWGCRLENYLTNPAQEPDTNRWETELAFRLA